GLRGAGAGRNLACGQERKGMMERWNVGKRSWRAALVVVAVRSIIPSFDLSAQSPQSSQVDYRARALAILKTVPLIDGHNDLADAIRERGGLDSVNIAVSQPKLMTDIPRLRAGRVGGQFWAA